MPRDVVDLDTLLGFGERVCAEETCRKVFLVTCPLKQYLYKIEVNSSSTNYFCCYTHYKKGQEKRDKEKANNVAAFVKRRNNKNL